MTYLGHKSNVIVVCTWIAKSCLETVNACLQTWLVKYIDNCVTNFCFPPNKAHTWLLEYLCELDLHQQRVLPPAASGPAPGVLGAGRCGEARRGATSASSGLTTSEDGHSGKRRDWNKSKTALSKKRSLVHCVRASVTCLRAECVRTGVCCQSPCLHRGATPLRSPAAPLCSEAPGSGWVLGEGRSYLEAERSDCPSL